MSCSLLLGVSRSPDATTSANPQQLSMEVQHYCEELQRWPSRLDAMYATFSTFKRSKAPKVFVDALSALD